MNLISTFLIIYIFSVVLSGITMLCEIFGYLNEEIDLVKRNYSNKSDKEIYEEIKRKINDDHNNPFIGLIIVFIPVANILLFSILFVKCIIDYFEKFKIWSYLGEKIENLYFWINDVLLRKQLNLKGGENEHN